MHVLTFDTETLPISANRSQFPPPFVAAGFKVDNGPVTITQDLDKARERVEIALAEGWLVVGHNLAFDLAVLGVVPYKNHSLHDTMFADMLRRLAMHDCSDDKGPPMTKKLEVLYGKPLGGKGTVQMSFRVGVPLTAEQRDYLTMDVEATYSVYLGQKAVPGGIREMTHQVRANLALNRLTTHGIRVDIPAIKSLKKVYQAKMKAAAKKLGDYYRPARTGKKGKEYEAGLRVKAFQKYVGELCEQKGIEPRLTKTGKVKTDGKSLAVFKYNEVVSSWLDYKGAQKMIKSSLNNWMASTTGRIHPRFRTIVRTGRTSSYDPNLQQIPGRGEKGNVKLAFIPDEGYSIWEADYGQLELCCLGYLTKAKMLQLINNGEDLHTKLAQFFFDKEEINKGERTLMKAANFGFPGGMSANTFREYALGYGLADPGQETAQKLLNAWLAFYPEMRAWRRLNTGRDAPQEVRHVVYGRTPKLAPHVEERAWSIARKLAYGLNLPPKAREAMRKQEGCPLLERWLMQRRVVTEGGRIRCPVSYTESRNAPFQSLGANVTKEALSMIVLDDPWDWNVHAFIHDAVLFSARDDGAVAEIRDRMLAAADMWLPGVRVTVEVNGPGSNWAEAKKLVWEPK